MQLMHHVEAKEALPKEQKALRKGRRGCLDAVTIDAAVANETTMGQGDLSIGWVDYQKAYDLVPHPWITRVLKAIRAPKEVRKAVERLMPRWRTNLAVRVQDEGTRLIPVKLKRGLFQGDSLSPLLFCLCVAPLSQELRKCGGFRSEFQREAITHLMFMDDLKVSPSSAKPGTPHAPCTNTRCMRETRQNSQGPWGRSMTYRKQWG